jgi:DinB superfamily
MTLERKERDALVARYRDGAAAFEAAVADVAEDELDVHPIAGEWSIREIAHHLADGELNSAVRLCRLIAEDEPVLPNYDEMEFARRLHYGRRPIATSLRAVAAARASTLTILELLSDEEWARTGTHTLHGAYGVADWLRDYATHPWDHGDQVRAVLRAHREGAG